MTIASKNILERIAQLSGTTGQVAYDTGTFSDCILNAENILGNVKDWNVIQDEAGNVISIIGKNGRLESFDTGQGLSQQYIAGNQYVTDALYDAGSGTITAQTGNILNEMGEVTKKGLVATASVGAQVLSGAVTALGGVMTGVRWYQNNPEFWTDVSQKLLPFAYDDPTDKSWGDIFYDALFPTAMDSDGNTYVQEKDLEFIKNTLVDGMFFNSVTVISNESGALKLPFDDSSVKFPIRVTYNAEVTLQSYTIKNELSTVSQKASVGLAVLWNHLASPIKYSDKPDVFCYDVLHTRFASDEPFTYYITSLDNKPRSAGSVQATFIKKYLTNPDIATKDQYYYSGPPAYNMFPDAQDNTKYDGVARLSSYPPIVNVPYAKSNHLEGSGGLDPSFFLMAAILFGDKKEELQYINTQLIPQANYPSADKTLKETYPEWYDNAVTTINPDWNPKQPESDENPKYIVWLPLQMPDATNNADEGNTQPDASQDEGQSGKPTPDTNIGEKTDEAVDNGVLPNPYPETQPDTDSGNTGTTPNPPVDPTPTPDVPVISGGTANALWRIYNPSESVLQAFGKWLWSDNWADIVKQLFANNPAEGIIGLHMIYVTPPVGGTSNIVVGYLDSGVASNWVSQQYVTIDCGTIQIPLYYQNALDYGYTKVYCYLPFIGIVPLDSYDIIGKSINIKYTVDILTGIVLAQISVMYGSYSAVLYTFNGSCSVEYPLTSGSRASQMLSLITGAVGGAVVGGVGGAVLGGARGALTGADVRMSGNLAGNAGAMGIRKPYIIVKRPVEYAAAGYSEFYGNPANVTYRISAFSGYVRVKSVHVSDIANATQAEKNEIENLLKSGVIVQ